MRRSEYGLYHPATEHDACGIGFVAHIRGHASRGIVLDGLGILTRLAHRAACGADPETGDGAGILTRIPERFFARELSHLGVESPRKRHVGIGQLFLPSDPEARARCERIVEGAVLEEGQRILGWRDVPVNANLVGRFAAAAMPVFRQVFIERRRTVPSAFERKLFVIKKLANRRVRESGFSGVEAFHIASMSAETIVYKGLLLPERLGSFYADLQHEEFTSPIALVHSRFSTNTFPTWDLAQPFSHICHNGEINTVRGNRNWMNARRSLLQSAKFGGNLARLAPIISPDGSDSLQFNEMLELLHMGGRTLPHAMMMMIPEAWETNEGMSDERRAFYDYSASLMEPWDGPAAVAFTDGHLVGATLDRNGLRPARWLVTSDDRVVLASEMGVVDVRPEDIVRKGRLQPGRMFLVDTEEGRIIEDEEVKRDIENRWPYRRWLARNVFSLQQFESRPPPPRPADDELLRLQRAFGYTDEDVRLLVEPMAMTGAEATGSMGTDTPLAVLSEHAPNLFDYFKQLFAQVTNPPIDPIRESLVMSLRTSIGMGGNTFDETPEHCHRLAIPGPVIRNDELATIGSVSEGVFEPTTLTLLYERSDDPDALENAVQALCDRALEAVDEGYNILVLSDRGVDALRLPIPSVMAVSAVHQHLVREGVRMQTGLIVETAEAREVHHFALLFGYGAAAVNPWLALDTIEARCEAGRITVPPRDAVMNFIKANHKGLLKVMSKMGISTIQSYRGAHIFEAVGLDRALIDRWFGGTVSRIEGVGFRELHQEVLARHGRGFGPEAAWDPDELPAGGRYLWRRRGELHKWNPATIASLQAAVRGDDAQAFETFSRLADDESEELQTLRGLLDWDESSPIPLDEVEPVEGILARFCTGAMSFGSISARTHEALAVAMNRLGGKSNTGEGGEEPERAVPDERGDSRRSAIKQVASGRFGVHAQYLIEADEIQIKMAQGAKPGEGGQLPGHKVSDRIARVRWSTPGVTLISPPPHHDIYSIEDLAQLILDLRTVNPRARISVKLVAEAGVGTVAAGVAKAGADAIIIAGDTGGTGASPLSSIKHAGLPWELGVAEAQQVLVDNELRGWVRLQADGGLRTARDVAVACLLGAEEFGFSTAPLIALGCVMLRKCHLNTCSVGIATQDPELEEKFTGDPVHVERYFRFVAEDLRRIMARLGFRTLDEMTGQVERLKARPLDHWKARRLDLGCMLVPPRGGDAARRQTAPRVHDLSDHIDHSILRAARGLIAGSGRSLEMQIAIGNNHRSAGAMLSGEIARRYGTTGLPDGAITVRMRGTAGQSFGAFLARGVTFLLEGEANDYVGKGLSGGRLAVSPPPGSRFDAGSNVIVGNTVLYGATAGEAFFCGQAGERFAVRNSGAMAVVEGVGDHACEYMTGGVVVVLGPTGRNFAAGMSGGMAFVFDREGSFRRNCNLDMVELESLIDESDIWLVHGLIENHIRHTGSATGRRILDNWELLVTRFTKVMPTDYKRVLQQRRAQRHQRFSGSMPGVLRSTLP